MSNNLMQASLKKYCFKSKFPAVGEDQSLYFSVLFSLIIIIIIIIIIIVINTPWKVNIQWGKINFLSSW